MDHRIARTDLHMRVQIIVLQLNQLGGIARLIQRLRHHKGHRLAHEPHTFLCQDRAQRVRPIRAIAVFHNAGLHGNVHARRLQVLHAQHQVHPGRSTRL